MKQNHWSVFTNSIEESWGERGLAFAPSNFIYMGHMDSFEQVWAAVAGVCLFAFLWTPKLPLDNKIIVPEKTIFHHRYFHWLPRWFRHSNPSLSQFLNFLHFLSFVLLSPPTQLKEKANNRALKFSDRTIFHLKVTTQQNLYGTVTTIAIFRGYYLHTL